MPNSLFIVMSQLLLFQQVRGFSRPSSSLLRRRWSSTTGSLNNMANEFDVIVVGGGHAGCDAAAAAARAGAKTALVTQRLDTIGELSCNPSMGGIGKGHLVREIDALDGLIGRVADEAGIHFRVLNQRKGPAVRGPRAQMDRDLYKASMQAVLQSYPNLHLIEASVKDLLLDESAKVFMESLAPLSSDTGRKQSGLLGVRKDPPEKLLMESVTSHQRNARIRGVVVESKEGSSREIMSRAVVITTGTFLRGVLMQGHERYSGGRHLRDSEQVEPPSVGLAQTLTRFNFPLGRMKTGTPPRLDGNTIDWDDCPIQPSEFPAQPFSHILQFNGEQPPMVVARRLINCHQTATNEHTHKLVLEYEHTLPIYDGMEGKGNGPRYCPSIYKKVQRFPDRKGHNCFLEPEGLNTNVVYPNGMSGPYPPEIQLKIMRSMRGLSSVDILLPGYDVEYDFVNPQALTHTLETKQIGGLYLAGQICGTTGYEEAASQGIVAGVNAGRAATAARDGEAPPLPFIIGRDEGYVGVLIDDLVVRGTQEPYRMFTSRAEYRMSLRADNADIRLTRKGFQYGLVRDEERLAAVDAREYLIEDQIQKLRSFSLKVSDWSTRGSDLMGGDRMDKNAGQRKTGEDVLAMPHVTLKDVEKIMEDLYNEDPELFKETYGIESMASSTAAIYDTVEASIKYKSSVDRQHKDMESWRKAQGLRIPPDVIYSRNSLPSMSNEEIEKLNVIRPTTFAEASQISGITPQSLVYLYHHVVRRNKQRDKKKSVAGISRST